MNNFQISDLLNLMKGDPQAMYDRLVKENSQFADFVQKNKEKWDSAHQKYMADMAEIKRMLSM